MNYTRLFHQRVKTRPWSGLKQLPHWWRSVRHTHRNAKISSNVLICLFSQQSGPHWHSHSPLISADFLLCIYDRSVKLIEIAGNLLKFPAQTDASNSQGYTAGYGNKLKKQIGTLEEILALRCVCFTLRQQLHECLSPDQGRVVGQLLK